MAPFLTAKDMGFRLRQLRQDAGYTQAQLAELVGISTQQIQKIEAGGSAMNTNRLQQLAAALAVPVDAFFSESGEAVPVQVSERQLLDSFREIENAGIKKSILRLTIHAAKVKRE